MLDKETPKNLALLLLRLVAGLILLYYGGQKLIGWLGGFGFQATLQNFETKMGIPNWAAVLAIVAEFFGGLGLILGALTRVAAFGAFCTMAVATFVNARNVTTIVSTPDNLFPIKEFSYLLSLAAICLALLLLGGGDWAVDAKLFKKKR